MENRISAARCPDEELFSYTAYVNITTAKLASVVVTFFFSIKSIA